MNNVIQILKKTGLFLFGVLLIIWGYKVNAANTEAKLKEEKESSKEQQPTVATPPAKEDKAVEQSPDKNKEQVTGQNKVDEKKQTQEVKPKTSTSTPVKSSTPMVEKKAPNKTGENPAKAENPTQTVVEKATPEESSGTQ